jgi:hypothetical protein
VLEKVEANMGTLYDLNVDSDVQDLLSKFRARSIKGHILNGVWGSDTWQGKAQRYVKENGYTYTAARCLVGSEPVEKTLVIVALEDLYDRGAITWKEVLQIKEMPVIDAKYVIQELKKGRTLESKEGVL